MSEERLNCPFCGSGETGTITVGVNLEPRHRRFKVYCVKCQVRTQDHKTLKEALRTWNTRAVSDDVARDALRIQVCKLGRLGAAYDSASTKYAYTYTEQPDNVTAYKLAKALVATSRDSHGDGIDQGLSLLKRLQEAGFGVFQIDAAMTGGGV